MVILRRTQKLASSLPIDDVPEIASESALGDWYVNRVIIQRRPLLLLVSSRSLLPVIAPAQGVASLPGRLPELIHARLARLHIPRDLITAEIESMRPVVVQKTADRAVVGILVDFAKALPSYLTNSVEAELHQAENQLDQTPCFAGRRFEDVVFPRSRTLELLRARWAAA